MEYSPQAERRSYRQIGCRGMSAKERSRRELPSMRMNDMMKDMTPRRAAAVTGGAVRGRLSDSPLSAITTDSRTVSEGCLFAAIPGTRVDGHDFIASAADAGAACVLCERFVEAPVAQIRVESVTASLRDLASACRASFSDIPFVGITGSVGKTTAKEMIAAVLSQHFRTLKTEKNLNNELGVPLTLFRLREGHEAAVVEMGISDFGEMTRLTEMVRPDLAVFTLIGDAHLEFLGSRQGVLRAKSEIVSGMPASGTVIVNGDDPLLRTRDFGRRRLCFGFSDFCDIRAKDVEMRGENGTDCTLASSSRSVRVHIPAAGRHMIHAALAAAAVGWELGLSEDEICRGIASYEIVGSRGRILHRGGITILDDCYNANPNSMRASLDVLTGLPGRRVAILGDMLELGEEAPLMHRQIGEYARRAGVKVIACGALAAGIAQGAQADSVWFGSPELLLQALPDLIREGDAVLIKASHSVGLQSVVQALSDLFGQE